MQRYMEMEQVLELPLVVPIVKITMIIEEATAALREILPRMVREIAQKNFEEHKRDQEALRFDKGNDYY